MEPKSHDPLAKAEAFTIALRKQKKAATLQERRSKIDGKPNAQPPLKT